LFSCYNLFELANAKNHNKKLIKQTLTGFFTVLTFESLVVEQKKLHQLVQLF